MSQSQSVTSALSVKRRDAILRWLFSWEGLFFAGLLLLGMGLRLLNLTNPPLDFHPTRQLRSAIIARGMYYQSLPNANPRLREIAIQTWGTMEVYEPPILERLVAETYRLIGGEHLWVARVYSSLFWVLGGAVLFAFVRRIFSPLAALCSMGFFLILPWGVIASRAFQPDPWMVMWVIFSAYTLYRWMETEALSWKWGVLAGLCSGLAILIKVYAGYPVAGMALGLLLTIFPKQKNVFRSLLTVLRRPQLWVYAAMVAIIPGIYYFGLGDRSASFASFWIFSFTPLLLDSKFYIHWLGLIRGLFDVMIFFAALLGMFLFPGKSRAQVIGLWAGYFLIGATFPFQIYTHDYYSLVLVPIAAISLAPFFHLFFSQLRQQAWIWKAAGLVAIVAVAGYYAWVARSQVLAAKYANEPIPWQIMGKEIPENGAIIGLTHDYGNRIKYYGWRTITRIWPSQGDFDLSEAAGTQKIDNFDSYFRDQTNGMDYFLVTLFGDFDAQPALKAMLYDHYPIYKQGDGYILFDLRHPTK